MDNNEQVLIVNTTQLSSVRNQFEYINKELQILSQKKKYKKIYSLLSKFFDRYDHSNQIHLNDKIHFQNILLTSLNKIFQKLIFRDMTKKNIIDVKVWKNKTQNYLQIYPLLLNKLTHCFELMQADTKQRIRDQIRNSILKDQLSQQITMLNKNIKLKLDPIIIQLNLEQEFQIYLKNVMIYYRLLSYQEFSQIEKIKFAQLSHQISKILLDSKGKRVQNLSNYVLCSTNVLVKHFEMNNDNECKIIIEEVNNSDALKYLIYLVQQIEVNIEFKYKLKCKWKFMKLLKPMIWFWMQSIYYYQSVFKFDKCQAIMHDLKWLCFYYLIPNDQISSYIQNVQAQSYSKYRELIYFNQFVESICLDEEVGLPRLKELVQERRCKIEEDQQYKESINYYYNVIDKNTQQQPKFYYTTPKAKIQVAPNTDLAFIEIPIENLSSMDTRQSSKTLKCPKRMNTSFNIQKSFRGSISQFSASFTDKKNQIFSQDLCSQETQPSAVPMLDKMIKQMIENKISFESQGNKCVQSQQLLSKEKLQQKENQFYKKLLKYKTQFSKFVTPVKLKSNQELLTKQELQMKIIDQQTFVDSKIVQPTQQNIKQNDQDISLLSFEKPGVQLGPLQRLKKIIFSHPEVFSLHRFRQKLKSSKKWYNRTNSIRMSNARRSVMVQKTKEQLVQELDSLRERSQYQLRKKLSETQLLIENVDKQMRSQSLRIRCSRQGTEQQLQIENQYQSLSRSIIKSEQKKVN